MQITIMKGAYVERIALQDRMLKVHTNYGVVAAPLTAEVLESLALSAGNPKSPAAAAVGATLRVDSHLLVVGQLLDAWLKCANPAHLARKSKSADNRYLDEIVSDTLHQRMYALMQRKGLIKSTLDGMDHSSLLRQATKHVSHSDLMKAFKRLVKDELKLVSSVEV